MDTRYQNAIEEFLDTLMDYGVAHIKEAHFRRYYGISRIGHRLKQNFENRILERIEMEYDNPENCSVHIYAYGDDWTFILEDDETKIRQISSWAGSE
ncbi:hypothetical protein J4729_23820 [Leisingera sp. HS039]|uniref:hypothetical protein n=1 Tax=Leisingera sp. HS039 TaxID=2818496 RepID=UPI001B3A70C8|nr:hypothetical protein [Leisingera sp. HS039]MBQ4827532.1 hypothetical protein [Leisingera sp. HS039]